MNKKYLFLSFVSVFILFNTAHSQNINYFGLFPTLDLGGKISDKWGYNVYLFDAIKPYNSTTNQAEDKNRSLYIYGEAGLSYNITDKLSITAAYVHERQNPFSSNYRVENRLFQQLTLKLPFGKTELKQRLRFDERFVQNRTTGETPFTHRLRYLIGIKHPLTNKMYVTAYSEAFFNTTQGKSFKFDENWSALQLGFKVNDKNSIEAGLLFVGWINNSKNDWLNQFYLQTTWVSQLNFN